MHSLTRGQIWIETVLYTLIGIALIGLVLTFALPKITAAQERAVVGQSIGSMQALADALEMVGTQGVGNVRVVTFALRSGQVVFDGIQDTITLTLPEQTSMYSQPGAPVTQGSVKVLTREQGGKYQVTLDLSFPRMNLTIGEQDTRATLTAASTAHRITARTIDTQAGKVVVSLETG